MPRPLRAIGPLAALLTTVTAVGLVLTGTGAANADAAPAIALSPGSGSATTPPTVSGSLANDCPASSDAVTFFFVAPGATGATPDTLAAGYAHAVGSGGTQAPANTYFWTSTSLAGVGATQSATLPFGSLYNMNPLTPLKDGLASLASIATGDWTVIGYCEDNGATEAPDESTGSAVSASTTLTITDAAGDWTSSTTAPAGPVSTTTTLTGKSGSTLGSVDLSAAVTAADTAGDDAVGTVNFFENGSTTPLNPAPIVVTNGTATWSGAGVAGDYGAVPFAAEFTPADATAFSPSTSPNVNVGVTEADVTITVAAKADPKVATSTDVTYAESGLPSSDTQYVYILPIVDGSPISAGTETGATSAGIPLSGGHAAYTATGLKAGIHKFSAELVNRAGETNSAYVVSANTVDVTTAATSKSLTATAPKLSGTDRVGATLIATPGTSTPSGATASYSWKLPTGAVIGTNRTLVVPTTASGKKVTLTVTWKKSGYTGVAKTVTASIAATTKPAVSTLYGADRFATAIAVSKDTFPVAGSAKVVFVASGENFPDALSAAPAAAKLGGPLLLTQPTSLPSAVAGEIKRLGPSKIVIVGETAAVSSSVQSALSRIAPTTRIGGADRYATSLAIAKYAYGTKASGAFIATGATFPDALSAAAYAGSKGWPVLLVNGTAKSAPSSVTGWLRNAKVSKVEIAGGTAAVSTGVANSVKSATRLTPTRLGGADRYATSQLISAQFSGAADAYLATGLTFPDALTGAAAAADLGSPLYVIPSTCVPGAVLSKTTSWKTGTIKALGGPAALAEPAIEDLRKCS
ncbi:cell wall-binding repeat-containing protein [Gryllotalpicola reticulitermitis]|uniref:Cell wall-binding repeat-containing protein n=1 Tax=Gryllotalpicola reticulitermitis TaxID=1184153 RepID=A0ABV8QCI2_9MICO